MNTQVDNRYWLRFLGLGTQRPAQCIAGDTTTGSVHRWGHNDRLSASLGTGRYL
ncbi:MAG: hypothetical protein KA716_24105 [Gloeotrichia echinulata DEX184]